jgi:hypothetical protein
MGHKKNETQNQGVKKISIESDSEFMIPDHLHVIERLISSLYPLEEKALNNDITCDTTSYLSKMRIMKQEEVGPNPKTKR